eukprot:jgi/Mesvir1/26230/Mv02406-RA.1
MQEMSPAAFTAWCDAACKHLVEKESARPSEGAPPRARGDDPRADIFGDDSNGVFVRCPNASCRIPIEKLPPSNLPDGVSLCGVPELDKTPPFTETGADGERLSRHALLHRATHRYRCPKCLHDFCGQCMASPYHTGRLCDEHKRYSQAPRCRFCAKVLPYGESPEELWQRLLETPTKMLLREVQASGLDTSWCIERQDLCHVLRQARYECCEASACQDSAKAACTRLLSCGHRCGGVRGEGRCLPCLEEGCRDRDPGGALPSADDSCPICYTDALRSQPAIQLGCGHVTHVECARRKVKQGYPGPSIQFGFLNCPLCMRQMEHPVLEGSLQAPLQLLDQVKAKASKRLRLEGMHTRDEVQPGGTFEGRPGEFAMNLFSYYLCFKCKRPFYGGKHECLAAGPPNAGPRAPEDRGDGYDPQELLCGGCSAVFSGLECTQPGHGTEFMDFKCQFCCSVANYFCFGTTHFCNKCHQERPDAHRERLPQCSGSKAAVGNGGAPACPLGIPVANHPVIGVKFCLGCALCRQHDSC